MRKFLKDHDILTKLLSVLIACVVWIWVTSIKNPIVDLEYNDIIVDITSQTQLRDNYSLVITENQFPKVSVTLSGEREIVTRVSHSNIVITSDISNITEPGTYDLNYIVKLPYDTISVKKSSPSKISITVDKIETKTIPLSVNLKGTPEKYYSFEQITAQDNFTISAPSNVISQIDYATVEVDIDNMNTDLYGLYPVKFYSQDGKLISDNSIIPESETVLVTGDVYKSATVPFTVEFEDESIEENIRSIDYSMKNITITGVPSIVNNISEIVLGTIFQDDYESSRTKLTFDLPEIPGITYQTDSEITVTLSYNEYITHSFSISDYMIDSDITPLFDIISDTSISLYAKTSEFEKIDYENLKVDLHITKEELLSLESGTTLDVDFSIDVSNKFDVTYSNKLKIKVK